MKIMDLSTGEVFTVDENEGKKMFHNNHHMIEVKPSLSFDIEPYHIIIFEGRTDIYLKVLPAYGDYEFWDDKNKYHYSIEPICRLDTELSPTTTTLEEIKTYIAFT